MLRIYIIKPAPDPRTLPYYYSCLAVVPFRKKSLAIVPFRHTKTWADFHLEQTRQTIAELCDAFKYLAKQMELSVECFDDFNNTLALALKRGRGLRWCWSWLLQILGIH